MVLENLSNCRSVSVKRVEVANGIGFRREDKENRRDEKENRREEKENRWLETSHKMQREKLMNTIEHLKE